MHTNRVIAAWLAAALIGVLLSTMAAAAPGLPATTVAATASGEARAPYGWVDFCNRVPAECRIDPNGPEIVTLTPTLMRTVSAINRGVNKEIEPMTDQEHWGTIESWDLPGDGIGDCEDYVLLKRKRLAAAGVPRRAMRVTVVLDEVGDGHAVLMLRTDRGDLILDNKHDDIRPWMDTGYTFIKRESEHRLGWTSLGGTRSPNATASR